MAKRLWGALLAAGLAAASGPASGQVLPNRATDVAPVTVTGRRPSVDQARRDACLEAMKDPRLRDGLLSGALSLRARTRPPRNPDYSAPPTAPLDAPLPEVKVDAPRVSAADLEDISPPGGGDDDARALSRAAAAAVCAPGSRSRRPVDGSAPPSSGAAGSALFWSRLTSPRSAPGSSLPDLPRSDRAVFGSFRSAGRLVKKPDTSLPLAFALFDQGRYELALDAFRTSYKKVADVDGGDEAALHIGKIYLHALGERRDPAEAARWLKLAATSYFNPRNDIQPFDPKRPDYTTAIGEASMILADLYTRGDGAIAKDPAEGRKWLERAFATGYIPAAKDLGDLYYHGVDTPRDPQKAFRHYMDAASYAYAPAAVMVAAMYRSGEAPGGMNERMAAVWNNVGARLENPDALYALAVAYDRGEGVTADPERALAFYKTAAVSGYAPAQAAIGTYFYTGEQTPKDLAVARGWFEQAALGEDADGMVNLAAMMARGEGGEVDRVGAWGWLKIAEMEGHPKAAAAASALEARFTAVERLAADALGKDATTHAAAGD